MSRIIRPEVPPATVLGTVARRRELGNADERSAGGCRETRWPPEKFLACCQLDWAPALEPATKGGKPGLVRRN